MISKVRIQNFKSVIDTEIEFNDSIFILAGQNEAGKSSILEALEVFENRIINKENLNFEEENKGNLVQRISVTYQIVDDNFFDDLIEEFKQFKEDVFENKEENDNIILLI